jgi:hypothetical protein
VAQDTQGVDQERASLRGFGAAIYRIVNAAAHPHAPDPFPQMADAFYTHLGADVRASGLRLSAGASVASDPRALTEAVRTALRNLYSGAEQDLALTEFDDGYGEARTSSAPAPDRRRLLAGVSRRFHRGATGHAEPDPGPEHGGL